MPKCGYSKSTLYIQNIKKDTRNIRHSLYIKSNDKEYKHIWILISAVLALIREAKEDQRKV